MEQGLLDRNGILVTIVLYIIFYISKRYSLIIGKIIKVLHLF